MFTPSPRTPSSRTPILIIDRSENVGSSRTFIRYWCLRDDDGIRSTRLTCDQTPTAPLRPARPRRRSTPITPTPIGSSIPSPARRRRSTRPTVAGCRTRSTTETRSRAISAARPQNGGPIHDRRTQSAGARVFRGPVSGSRLVSVRRSCWSFLVSSRPAFVSSRAQPLRCLGQHRSPITRQSLVQRRARRSRSRTGHRRRRRSWP